MRPIPIALHVATGHNVTFWCGVWKRRPRKGDMGVVADFGAYRRRVDDAGDFRARRRDTPRDMAALLALASDIELEEKIILDRTHYDR